MKRWRDARMLVRRTVTAVVDASTRFRRIAGAPATTSKLMIALRAHDVATNSA